MVIWANAFRAGFCQEWIGLTGTFGPVHNRIPQVVASGPDSDDLRGLQTDVRNRPRRVSSRITVSDGVARQTRRGTRVYWEEGDV